MRPASLSVLAIVLPGSAAVALLLVFTLLDAFGYAVASYGRPRNIAEAAAMGSASETLRLLRDGHDPTRVEPVRPELISTLVTRATALEAAVWSHHVELIRLLDEHGAIGGPALRHELACVASDLRFADTVQYLSPDGPPSCVPEAAIERVFARSRQHSLAR